MKVGTDGLLIIRHDEIVCEWYGEKNSATKPHGTASLAKSLIGGMSLAAAMNEGRIGADDLAGKFVPAWKSDARKSKITIGQLASHTSGLEDAEDGKIAHEKLTGWKGDFWKRVPDPFTISRDLTPAIYEPGEQASYSNPGMAMLAYAVTASLAGGEEKDLKALLRERVMKPIGVSDKEWSIGYGKPCARGGDGFVRQLGRGGIYGAGSGAGGAADDAAGRLGGETNDFRESRAGDFGIYFGGEGERLERPGESAACAGVVYEYRKNVAQCAARCFCRRRRGAPGSAGRAFA